MRKTIFVFVSFLTVVFMELNGCSSDDPEIGTGPVKELKIDGTINTDLVTKGQTVFDAKCKICHTFDKRLVGPPLNGVTKKRKPEWIMNMILNPGEMINKNPHAKELLKEYMVPMVSQNITQDEARNILEYFRSIDNRNDIK